MIAPERASILKALAEMAELYPDWRFGQMVENITVMAAVGFPTPIYDIEDDVFLKALQEHLEHRRSAVHP